MKKSSFSRTWASLLLTMTAATAQPALAWESNGGCGCDLGIEISGEFLWWNVCHSDDLLIGVTDTVNTASGEGTRHITNGTTQTFKFDYEPGFRVNAFYRLPCSDWAIGASYTYFRFHESNDYYPSPGGTLWASTFPITDGLINAAADSAHATASVHYDLLDLTLAWTSNCDGIRNRFYGGVRSMIFQERFNTTYQFDEGAGIEPGEARWNVYMPAIGMTLGYDGIYEICGGWGLQGRLGVSALGARATHHQNWSFTTAESTTSTKNHTRHNQVICGWDAAVGIHYDTRWCCMPVQLAFGYEVYDWWNMPRQRYFTSTTYPGVSTTDETGRFTVHGAYVRLGTSF